MTATCRKILLIITLACIPGLGFSGSDGSRIRFLTGIADVAGPFFLFIPTKNIC